MTDIHPERWMQGIDRVTARVRDITAGLAAKDLAWQPSPDAWSVATILRHLISVNDSYDSAVRALRSSNYRPPLTARIPGLPVIIGSTILKTVSPDTRRKSKTLRVWDPPVGMGDPGVIAAFVECQERLKVLIRNAADLLDRGAIISSPAGRAIVYPIGMAFEILVQHEERHLQQIIRTVAQRPGSVQDGHASV